MRTVLLVVLVLCPALVSAQDAKIEEIGKSPVEVKFSSGGQVHMDLCSSGIELRGVDENVLRVSYWPEGGRTGDLRVRLETAGSRGDIKVAGCPHNNFQMKIEVPKASNLYVRMFAGELKVSGITGDKDVQLHAGQLTMNIGEPSDYSHVYASVNSGELDARPFTWRRAACFARSSGVGRASTGCMLTWERESWISARLGLTVQLIPRPHADHALGGVLSRTRVWRDGRR